MCPSPWYEVAAADTATEDGVIVGWSLHALVTDHNADCGPTTGDGTERPPPASHRLAGSLHDRRHRGDKKMTRLIRGIGH